jgi:AcrR family transcriptional regulator
VPRNREEARRRLQQAALELFRERGYDSTTAAEIAARAGVTERTFFRHFPDKREVLFDGEAALRAGLVTAVANAPDNLAPLQILFFAFQSVEQMLEDNRPFSEPRHEVIVAIPALRERELAKVATINSALAFALQQRGVEDRLATLAVQTGMAAFSHGANAWFNDPSRRLHSHLVEAFNDLNALCWAMGSPSPSLDSLPPQ